MFYYLSVWRKELFSKLRDCYLFYKFDLSSIFDQMRNFISWWWTASPKYCIGKLLFDIQHVMVEEDKLWPPVMPEGDKGVVCFELNFC